MNIKYTLHEHHIVENKKVKHENDYIKTKKN
jgi:hypothetical protein